MTEELYRLGLGLDTSELKAGTEDLKRFEDRANKAADTADKFERRTSGAMSGVAKDAQRATTELNQLANAAGLVGGRLGAMLALGVGAAGTGIVAWLTAQTAEAYRYAGALENLSEKTGLSTTALQGFDAVAKQSGVTLNEVARTVNKLADDVYRSSKESGKQNKMLTALGLDPKEIKDGEDALYQLSDAFKRLDASDRVSAAKALGISENMIGLLSQGSEAIKRQANEVKAFAPLTEDAAKASDIFEDSLTRLERATDGIGRSLWNSIGPDLARITKNFANATVAARGFFGGMRLFMFTGGGEDAEKRAAELDGQIRQLEEQIKKAEETGVLGRGSYSSRNPAILNARREQLQDLKAQRAEVERLLEIRRQLAKEREPVPKVKLPPIHEDRDRVTRTRREADPRSVEDYATRLNKIVGGAINESAIVKTRELQDAIFELDKLFFDGKLPIDLYSSALEKLTGTMSRVKPQADEIATLLQRLPSARQEEASRLTGLADERFFSGEITERQHTELLQLINGYRDVEEQIKRNNNAGREWAFTMESAFESAIFKGEELSDVLGGLAQDFARIFVREQITSPLAKAAGDLLGSIPWGSLFGFADGGRPPVGRASIVGEEGPELFVPGVEGTIIPNHKLGGTSFTFAPVTNIDARGADAGVEQRLMRVLAQRDEQLKREIPAIVSDANRRGALSFT